MPVRGRGEQHRELFGGSGGGQRGEMQGPERGTHRQGRRIDAAAVVLHDDAVQAAVVQLYRDDPRPGVEAVPVGGGWSLFVSWGGLGQSSNPYTP